MGGRDADEQIGVDRDAFANGGDGEHQGGGALEGVGDPPRVAVGRGGVEALPGLVPEVEEEEAAGHGQLQDRRGSKEGCETHGEGVRDADQAVGEAGGLLSLEGPVPDGRDGHHVQQEAEAGVGN